MNKRLPTIVLIIAALVILVLSLPGFPRDIPWEIKEVFAAPEIEITLGVDFLQFEPDYDSGWVSAYKNNARLITHNLGGDPDTYFVDLQFKDTGGGSFGVHQEDYGGEEYVDFFNSGRLTDSGAHWFGLTNKDVRLFRQADDMKVDKVRLRIWIAPPPTFDSGWTSISASTSIQIDHKLLINTDDYFVDMQFKDLDLTDGIGVNQYGYGMIHSYVDASNFESRGALWRNLDETSIFVARGKHDTAADKVRVRIWENKFPDYDSDWFKLETQITEHLLHNLKKNSDKYVVDLQFKDEVLWGINQNLYGSNTFNSPPNGLPVNMQGASWSNLTSTHISVWREGDDISAPNARVRIWVTKYDNDIYLPIATRDK